MKDYNKLINKLLRISEDMHWELLTEAAMAIRELQQDAARYRWLHDNKQIKWKEFLFYSGVVENGIDATIDKARGAV